MAGQRVHYLQHVAFEGLGSIEPWLRDHGHTLHCTRLYDGELPPPVTALDWLIVMGGPMGIYDYDDHPWLREEKAFIRACIDAGKTVLGICLGAQLIADVLGAPVTRNREKEIGWFPIEVKGSARTTAIGQALADATEVFHWHGDTFALPGGAIHLARSAACDNQAFLYSERVLGLQCHLETTTEGAADLCNACADELVPGRFIQRAEEILATPERFSANHRVMDAILAALAPADTPDS